jgi:tripeptide aminopeptidase
MVAIASHHDTVFDHDTDLTPRRDGTKFNAPGIVDSSRGLAAILAMARADGSGRSPAPARHPLRGSVGEESPPGRQVPAPRGAVQ